MMVIVEAHQLLDLVSMYNAASKDKSARLRNRDRARSMSAHSVCLIEGNEKLGRLPNPMVKGEWAESDRGLGCGCTIRQSNR